MVKPQRKSIDLLGLIGQQVEALLIQTIDALADGITPTFAEAAAAARIRMAFPDDELRLTPNVK